MFSWDCCRMCLSKNNLNPLSFDTEEVNYVQMVFNVTGVKITLWDELPKEICMECKNFIENSSKFRERCQETQKQLCRELKIKIINLKHKTEVSFNKEVKLIHPTLDIKVIKEELHEGNEQNNYLNQTDYVTKLYPNKNNFPTFTNDRHSKEKHAQNHKTELTKSQQTKKAVIEQITINQANQRLQGNSTALEEDNKTERRRKVYKCDYCGKISTTKACLSIHMKNHTGFDIVCEHCGVKCLTKRRLLLHCRSKHGYERVDKCSHCDYRGCSMEQVRRHELSIHSGLRPFACNECNATFVFKTCYLQHVAIHLPEKTVQCTDCPARFKSATLMRIHAHRHKKKRDQYRYICYICDKNFARRRNVLKHLRCMHSVLEPTRVIERIPR